MTYIIKPRGIKYQNIENKAITIFLTGSIEMGKAFNWQDFTANIVNDRAKAFTQRPLVFYNPTRDDWNSNFGKNEVAWQINWEQERLKESNYIFMYLDPDTKSPISLLEFGEYISTGKLILVCDSSFYRYNNLEQTAKFFNQKVYPTIEKGIEALLLKLTD